MRFFTLGYVIINNLLSTFMYLLEFYYYIYYILIIRSLLQDIILADPKYYGK